jgi:hypothetical protein
MGLYSSIRRTFNLPEPGSGIAIRDHAEAVKDVLVKDVLKGEPLSENTKRVLQECKDSKVRKDIISSIGAPTRKKYHKDVQKYLNDLREKQKQYAQGTKRNPNLSLLFGVEPQNINATATIIPNPALPSQNPPNINSTTNPHTTGSTILPKQPLPTANGTLNISPDIQRLILVIGYCFAKVCQELNLPQEKFFPSNQQITPKGSPEEQNAQTPPYVEESFNDPHFQPVPPYVASPQEEGTLTAQQLTHPLESAPPYVAPQEEALLTKQQPTPSLQPPPPYVAPQEEPLHTQQPPPYESYDHAPHSSKDNVLQVAEDPAPIAQPEPLPEETKFVLGLVETMASVAPPESETIDAAGAQRLQQQLAEKDPHALECLQALQIADPRSIAKLGIMATMQNQLRKATQMAHPLAILLSEHGTNKSLREGDSMSAPPAPHVASTRAISASRRN